MNSKIKVVIRRVKDTEPLLAFADITLRVKFGEITIKRFKILENDSKKPWVAFPQAQYQTFLSTKYINLLHMNKRVEDYIKNQIMKEYKNAIKYSKK